MVTTRIACSTSGLGHHGRTNNRIGGAFFCGMTSPVPSCVLIPFVQYYCDVSYSPCHPALLKMKRMLLMMVTTWRNKPLSRLGILWIPSSVVPSRSVPYHHHHHHHHYFWRNFVSCFCCCWCFVYSSVVVVTCFHSDRYHPAYCTSVASSSLVTRRKWLVDDVDVDGWWHGNGGANYKFDPSQNFTMLHHR